MKQLNLLRKAIDKIIEKINVMTYDYSKLCVSLILNMTNEIESTFVAKHVGIGVFSGDTFY